MLSVQALELNSEFCRTHLRQTCSTAPSCSIAYSWGVFWKTRLAAASQVHIWFALEIFVWEICRCPQTQTRRLWDSRQTLALNPPETITSWAFPKVATQLLLKGRRVPFRPLLECSRRVLYANFGSPILFLVYKPTC